MSEENTSHLREAISEFALAMIASNNELVAEIAAIRARYSQNDDPSEN